MRILIVSALMLISAIVLANHDRGHVDVKIGDLTEKGQYGQQVFNQNCAACHGVNAQGTPSGPPLIHSFYNPGHHSNEAFYRAIKNGVQQHHWSYGNMPPQPQIGFMEMTALLAFIRETQEHNGIKAQEHKM